MLDHRKSIAKRAKLDPTKFDLKTFRSTYAAGMLRRGFDVRTVQHWMGHKSLETTMRHLAPATDVHDELHLVTIPSVGKAAPARATDGTTRKNRPPGPAVTVSQQQPQQSYHRNAQRQPTTRQLLALVFPPVAPHSALQRGLGTNQSHARHRTLLLMAYPSWWRGQYSVGVLSTMIFEAFLDLSACFNTGHASSAAFSNSVKSPPVLPLFNARLCRGL
jgi:hypothetical protein